MYFDLSQVSQAITVTVTVTVTITSDLAPVARMTAIYTLVVIINLNLAQCTSPIKNIYLYFMPKKQGFSDIVDLHTFDLFWCLCPSRCGLADVAGHGWAHSCKNTSGAA